MMKKILNKTKPLPLLLLFFFVAITTVSSPIFADNKIKYICSNSNYGLTLQKIEKINKLVLQLYQKDQYLLLTMTGQKTDMNLFEFNDNEGNSATMSKYSHVIYTRVGPSVKYHSILLEYNNDSYSMRCNDQITEF